MGVAEDLAECEW